MSGFKICGTIALGVIVGLSFSTSSWGEDGLFGIGLRGAQLAKTRPGNFMSAIPGGTFVVTVAHIAPSPEDAMLRGKPTRCDDVRFRIDTLHVKNRDGSIDVELGERQMLSPGESSRMVFEVEGDGTNLPTYELDLMGFRFRSEKGSSRCSIVANGLFYADSSTMAPIPIALIPSVSPAPDKDKKNRR